MSKATQQGDTSENGKVAQQRVRFLAQGHPPGEPTKHRNILKSPDVYIPLLGKSCQSLSKFPVKFSAYPWEDVVASAVDA